MSISIPIKSLVAVAALLVSSGFAFADCKREYPKPATINEAELTNEEKQLLAELREIEISDPKLVEQAKEIAENWESYGFTKCPVVELN